MLLGELVEPLVLPEALPVLLAPALPEVLPLEPWSLRHFSFSAPIMLSQRLLPTPVDEAPVPAPMLVPLEVVPVPALGAALPLVVALGAVLPLVVALGLVVVPVLALPAVPASPLRVVLPLVVALGLVPVVPALLEVPVPMVEPLEVLVLDLLAVPELVVPEPPSEAQPAPKATSAAVVAVASSFSLIRISFGYGVYAQGAQPASARDMPPSRNEPCAKPSMQTILRLAAGGAALVAAGLYARRRTAQAARNNPPQGRFVGVGGLRLHYVEKGEGPPLVLLHGLGSMVEDFISSGFLERAAARYRVIALDRPGYGHSDPAPRALASPWRQAAVLREALGKLDVRRPIVLGHSWGTLVALALALRYPGSVRSLVLVSGYFFPTVRLDALVMSPAAIPGIGDLLRFTLSPCLGRLLWPAFLRVIFSPSRPPPGGPVPTWLALRPAQLKAVAAETLMTVPAAFALSRRYRELAAPLVIVAGADDRYVSPRSQSMRLGKEVPHSTSVLVPGAGHMLHHTHAESILGGIEALRLPAIA